MGNYEQLKQSVSDVIKTNGNQEITGSILQNVLLTIVSSVGANATFAGIATPTTNPGTPDGPVFYLASESGTYTNFNAIELQAGLSVLMWNGSWSSQQIFAIDDEPTAGSNNLVKSGGVYAKIKAIEDAGYVFAGVATPTTNPGTPDGPVFYLASESGTYTNFNAIELQDGLSVLMWNGSWSSQQIFAIDDEPTAGSDNLVKSGGVQEELALGAVYDVSAKNPTAGPNNDGKFETLSALLGDTNLNTLIPTSVRKGGMSIKFVQSSDNRYYQYRYKLEYEDTIAGNEAFKNPENWAIEDDGVYTDNPEFLFARIDRLNNLLFWIRKKDGGIDWAVGVPKPVKNYINAKVNELWNSNNEKVDKVNNKSLIDEIVANLNYSGDNPEFKYLAKHLNETIAFGVKKDGTFFWTKGIPEHLVKYIKEQINKKPIHLTKPTSDNLCAFKCSDVETNWKGLNTMLFLHVEPWRPYYNNLSKYIEVLNSYNPSIVRTITWQFDVTDPDVISQYDTVLYYIAKENKEILLTTHMTESSNYKNITDWEPIFANIEFLARRYNGENLIYPANDAEAEGLPVFVKYWEFNNEMNYKLSSTAQVNVQKRFYNLIKSINSSFKVMSLGYSSGTDKLVLMNQEYVNSYDIYNFHTYSFNLKDFINDIQEHLNVNNYALDKEFWLTEYGPNMSDNSSSLSETFMANCVAIESLVALSFGASKCLYWANEYLVSNINPIEYYDTYNSLMFLYSIHGEGATKPILKENGGIYSLRWNFNNKVYTALYADKAINVDVVYNQSAIVYNYLGIQKEHKITQIDNNIIYIENSDNIIINLK